MTRRRAAGLAADEVAVTDGFFGFPRFSDSAWRFVTRTGLV